ncbi:retinaldehyde-binding protein 1-like [Anopheles bellator]|uniref:retinaldehyde-binding protein 1-like n=1 Tax=Anopheles bellator TaxID=139047 RepID=UPI002649E6C0|nr:retinaldehyde-binding protein 1-like [Anopheles bellator]
MSKLAAYPVVKEYKLEQEYRFQLPALYRKLAEETLRETDEIREHALAQMREWIVNNRHIHKVRMDDSFLLRFLRAQKLSVTMACEALERYLTWREMYPTWSKGSSFQEPIIRQMYDAGGLSVLGQGNDGRTVVLIQTEPFANWDPTQTVRFVTMILETLLEWEEVQIGGILVLLDYTGTSKKLFEIWGMTELKIVMEGLCRAYPIQYREVHGALIPKAGIPVAERALSFTPPKFRELVHCHAAVEDLWKHLEPSITPKKYGGTLDLDAVNKKFADRIEQFQNVVLGLDEMEIDLDHYSALWDEQNPDLMEAKAFKNLSFD